jgi:hypothetical protein
MKLNCSAARTAGIALLAGLALFSVYSAASVRYSDWSAPANLGPVVNSASEDFAPHISRNELSLYFASTRPGGFGGEDLWVSRRATRDDPWGPPVNLGPIVNTGANDRSPALSRDGHLLFFASNRAGGLGGLDLWVSWRAHTRDDFAWQPPVNLGALVNTAATDAGPNYFENDDAGIPLLFLASNRPGGAGGLDIYVSALTASGAFGAPVPVTELNGPTQDLTPGIRFDGLEIIIASDRVGTVGGQDLWVSTRETAGDSWSSPVNLGPVVNSSSSENFPSLSSDREALFFNSNRPSGFGGSDLYVSTRTKLTGPQ